MKQFVYLLLSLCTCAACMRTTPDIAIEENKHLFLKLDSLIEQVDYFIVQKEEKIERLKAALKRTPSPEEQHELLQSLYWEYRVYDADSALRYTTRNLKLAEECDNHTWRTTVLLDFAFVYTANGLLDEAMKIMQPMNTTAMPRELRSRYYGQMRTLCSRLQLYSSGDRKLSEHYGEQYALYSDSVLQTATPDEPRYLYSRVWRYQDDPKERELVKMELEKVKQELTPDNRNYSILTYNLASLYEKEGNRSKWLENMILAGMADVRAVNRDIGSLHALASYLYNNNELDRAYRYSTYCQEIGNTYKSRVRLLHQSELQNQIHQSYIERDRLQEERLKLFLTLISILTGILITLLYFLSQQIKKRIKANKELDKANLQQRLLNEELKKLNTELKDVNSELRDANYIKEEYIGQIFNLCSTYISKMEEYRKNLNRKLKVNQIEEIKKLITTTSTVNNEMKEFYESFDSIFLHIYPDFVADFNKLLRPEEHIEVKTGRLNTELRIHALIRLGITDSEKIASFLHCSQQTVYNNRSMTCNKSLLPKDSFIQAVKELGKSKE